MSTLTKPPLLVLTVLCAALTGPLMAADNTVTTNGVTMPVAAAVAIWDAEDHELDVKLLPVAVTDEQIEQLQKSRTTFLDAMPSPDEARWPHWMPYASYELSWNGAPGAAGDAARAEVLLYSRGIDGVRSNLNFNFFPGDLEATLEGAVETGGTIRLISRGDHEDILGKIAWDLDVEARVVPKKAMF